MENTRLSCAITEDGALAVALAGDWLLESEVPDPAEALKAIHKGPVSVHFDTGALGRWDTALIITLLSIYRVARDAGVKIDDADLPAGARQLIALALRAPRRDDARRTRRRGSFLHRVGTRSLETFDNSRAFITFCGEVVLSLGRFVRGRATWSHRDFFQYLQEAGAEALPIASLISLLIGMIFAFVGAMQLRYFGAGIYTADLVAIAMVREMAPIMTAILMAGRTGAAYAAQIGTMQVNEEVDALTTIGIHPIDYLVTPRVISLVLMLPLLTLYGCLMGIVGGMLVGLFMLDISVVQYTQQTVQAVTLEHLFGGLFKSVVYGTLVALAGCQQGMACGGSAQAVGQSTTRAVVMGIVMIVVSASILTVIYINLGI